MAKAMKRGHGKEPEVKEHGALAALRPSLAALPQWMERLDELVGEKWTPLWPMMRFSEELALKVPPVDVFEEDGELVLKAELPGMRREDLAVEIAGGVVTLSGKKQKEEKIEKKDYYRLERSAGAFTRTIRLPVEIELERATARFVDGVLELRAPKAEAARSKHRKIEIG